MSKTIGFSEEEMDTLKGVIDRGIGNAMDSLSQIVNRNIEIKASLIDFVPLKEIPSMVDGPNVLSVGTYMRIMGDISGTSLLVFTRESALVMVDLLYGREIGKTEVLTQDDRSAFGEIGNILTGSYLTELGDFLGIRIYFSTPCIVFDLAKSLIAFVLRGINSRIDNVLIIKVKFISENREIDGEFVLLLDSTSFDIISKKLDKRLRFSEEK